MPHHLEELSGNFDAFYRSVKGNFSVNAQSQNCNDQLKNTTLSEEIQGIFANKNHYITSISGVPALHHGEKHSVENFVQGIEQLTEALRGSAYTLMVQATPISSAQVRSIRQSYEEIYTHLSPFAKTECQFNTNENWGTAENHSESTNKSQTITQGSSHTDNKSTTTGGNSTKTKNPGAIASGVLMAVAGVGLAVAAPGILAGGGAAVGVQLGAGMGALSGLGSILNGFFGTTSEVSQKSVTDGSSESKSTADTTGNASKTTSSVSKGVAVVALYSILFRIKPWK